MMKRKIRKPLTEKQKKALDEGRKSWQPGKSGNPSGRPLGSKSKSTYLKHFLSAKFIDKNGKSRKNPFDPDGVVEMLVEEMMELAIIKKALGGDVNAYREIKDTVYGKNPDIITGDPSAPLQVSQTTAELTGDALKAELEKRNLPSTFLEE